MITDDFLSHYGVKGMRWGVRKARRQERNEIKEDFKQRVRTEHAKELAKRSPKINALKTQTQELARSNNFDLDDGGGGRTKKDQAAGKRYMDKWDQIEKLELDAEDAAVRNATKQLLEIHGAKKLKDLNIKLKETS